MGKKKNKVEIVRKTKKVEFWYNENFYTYEYRSDSAGGFAFVFLGTTGVKIYGPYDRDCTDEGKDVYQAIKSVLHP